jgi:hypothetical protein
MNKWLVVFLSLFTSIVQLVFPQSEIKAGDYYVIMFRDSNRDTEVQNSIPWRNNKQNIPYKICDIRIVSFDNQMNCIKSHIYMVHQEKWKPLMESFHGTIAFVNDSTIVYTANCISDAPDDLTRGLMRCALPCDVMGAMEEEMVFRSSSIRKGNSLLMHQLDDLQLTKPQYRELKRILKICGLQMKNNRIIYPCP